jgi:hypothetical protein
MRLDEVSQGAGTKQMAKESRPNSPVASAAEFAVLAHLLAHAQHGLHHA